MPPVRDEAPTTALPNGPEFPITLRRTGGAASFKDVVVIRADGQIEVATRNLTGRTCTLSAAQRTEVVALFSILPTAAEAPTEAPESSEPPLGDDAPTDPILVTATDVHQRTLDLSSPSDARAAALANDLVADATLTVPLHTACKTPTAPPSASTN